MTKDIEYCYSLDEETYYKEFDMISDDLELGGTYYKGEAVPHVSSSFVSLYFIEGILEQLDERVGEELGECYSDWYFCEASQEAKEELLDFLTKWSAKHVDLSGFFAVKNSVAVEVTEDDLS